jgi:hypothetical protein
MATNLSSNKYVGEIKVGDCVCVRGHKPIAMGEILVMGGSQVPPAPLTLHRLQGT